MSLNPLSHSSHSSSDASAKTPLLRVDGLSVTFPSPFGPIRSVKNLSFQVNAGEILALVGESGSGKSVTARTLVGLSGENVDVQANAIELTRHDGSLCDLRYLTDRDWRAIRGREIGFVLQDALVSLDPLRKIGQEVAEPILTHRLLPREQIPARVAELLTKAGIPDPENRAAQYPHELSGGLRQRALIASALAAGPQLLIADEPTTALDATVQKQVLKVFAALAQAGHGVLLITHDLAVVADIADRVIVMQQGSLVEGGEARQLLSAPTHPYTRRLLAAIPTASTRGKWLAGVDPLQNGITPSAASLAANHASTDDTIALTADRIAVSFKRPDGSRMQAVNQVSLQIKRGETLGIVGESGSGKTTLGKVILALQKPDSGEVRLAGNAWSALTERERRPLRARIQTITQDPLSSFDPQFTVAQILRQPLRLRRDLSDDEKQRRILTLLEYVGLTPDLLTRRPTALSGGQRQRVSIAQALASDPEILICDEPVSALDVTTQAQVLDLLGALQRQLGLTMLFISHDLGVVQHMSHRIAVMKDGDIVETGPVEQIFNQPQHPYTRLLLSTVAE
ncbi:ABC transporter ATP binding protein [Pectobacterium atrosepticum SCRI1043]|uniref:ABC transporter ATP binding protein n=1 Tax=Pectobacterium atrosepticum (strain SCRI 1043 / ATCC BAA-672) TaxID=218491 RepID=Q6DA18_PECAS|nr:ABC transporter ATP-binding protein [Pectobacterium atrosepticum]GKV85894.1 ABC transporter ATP-binding protein [Pectobacterium carotovorum subsp. carotovorum]AIA69448.1 ABC transporter ATP-binding protein [Pectobacterium atrosepticum]AIK12352.1 ABC transporter ATP binding protein [Pectobacterium atrosepticum]ATY89288.1 ABC transporter ATP-binding protein [Pectobacterium atrosepticum]KFX15707.1 ABC transporter ATP-binding protein [Pectobacterium atrosepticum]